MSTSRQLFQIPSVRECLDEISAQKELRQIPVRRLKHCIRLYIGQTREAVQGNHQEIFADKRLWLKQLIAFIQRYHRPRLCRVINATGVILHTNLGRSLLPPTTSQNVALAGMHYTNLEFDLETGKRGSRYNHVESLVCELTGAEAALVVNNNAAAVLISLETLACGRDVLVSRGQLVEIGGSFRIPEIMERSGARLIEVGTTNRTHLHDYEAALSASTGLLLRVHCSNYRIIGFIGEVSGADLVRLGRSHKVPVMEDLGSGSLLDLSRFGLTGEPTVQEAVASGVDVLTFSGDKLLGGPQAGIIVGRKQYIEQIKKNPLNRALRIDKLTLAALESVLRFYLDEAQALQEIPTLRMIATPEEQVKDRATRCAQLMREQLKGPCSLELIRVASIIGGGALPEQDVPSWAVALHPSAVKASQLHKALRQAPMPVISRIEEERLFFDMRTVTEEDLQPLVESLQHALHILSQDTAPNVD